MSWEKPERDAIEIVFRGTPFAVRLKKNGDSLAKVTPVVCYDGSYVCGIGLLCNDTSLMFNHTALHWPHDLIAAWRGTEILASISGIDITAVTLFVVYLAGVRDPVLAERETYVQQLINQLGIEKYEQIMKKRVPEEIIRAILENQHKKSPPTLHSIPDEVRAGTMDWRPAFDDAGVKHPDQIEAERRRQGEIIAQFEELLASYAAARNIPRQSSGMRFIEGALLELVVEKEMLHTCAKKELVALASVVGELNARHFALQISPYPTHIWNETTASAVIQSVVEWFFQGESTTEDGRDQMSWALYQQVKEHPLISA